VSIGLSGKSVYSDKAEKFDEKIFLFLAGRCSIFVLILRISSQVSEREKDRRKV